MLIRDQDASIIPDEVVPHAKIECVQVHALSLTTKESEMLVTYASKESRKVSRKTYLRQSQLNSLSGGFLCFLKQFVNLLEFIFG